jgi:uncharacterized protein YjeT (DUF2065 family)
MGTDFLAAVALVLVIEGVLPFLNPAGVRRAMQTLAGQDDRRLRIGGLVSMIAGVLLLYFVKN